MIHYELRCSAEHDFDGWFRDSAGFDDLAAQDLVECPVCGSTKVARALMAPVVARRSRSLPQAAPRGDVQPEQPVPSAPPTPPAMTVGGEGMPDQVRAMLQRMRAEVERNCDYVGPDFAVEARKIHRGESEARNIYGETTPDQAETMAEEGIEFARIPWVPRADG